MIDFIINMRYNNYINEKISAIREELLHNR